MVTVAGSRQEHNERWLKVPFLPTAAGGPRGCAEWVRLFGRGSVKPAVNRSTFSTIHVTGFILPWMQRPVS